MVVIPSGLTSLLQGLDTHVNKAFKARCRAWWRRYAFGMEDPAQSILTNQDFLNLIRDAAADALSQTVAGGPLQGCASGSASFLHDGLTNALDGSEDRFINVRHSAVDPGRRAVLAGAAPLAPAAVADPGYGAEQSEDEAPILAADDAALSSEEGSDGAAAGRGVTQRVGAARDVWLQGLSSGAASSGSASPRGFVGPVGARRSTRRVRVAPAKQDLFTGGGGGREPRVAHPG